MQIGEGMTNKRDCETCVHAHPFGGWYDNRCDAWECEYINCREAIEAYKARKDKIILRCNTFMPKENFEQLKKEWEAQDPAIFVIPCSMEVVPPSGRTLCDFYVRDKTSGEIHKVGTDAHDSIWVDDKGTLYYQNLQNGDGCFFRSAKDDKQGYEFVPSDCGIIGE